MLVVAGAMAAIVLLAGAARPSAPQAVVESRAARGSGESHVGAPPSVRLTMAELHSTGGVPLGWRFSLPPGDVDAGRRAFDELGCASCHRVRATGLPDVEPSGPGPELTGMGQHHPPAYFAESLLNPDAVQVEGPGYLDEHGRSRMPTYPDLTAAQLRDLVAFLAGLRGPAGRCHDGEDAARPSNEAPPPPQAEGARRVFLTRVYTVPPGRFAAVERWFSGPGGSRLRSLDGVTEVETIVDRTQADARLVTVITFRDRTALDRYFTDATMQTETAAFESLVTMHSSAVRDAPPLYPAASLSAAPAELAAHSKR